MAEKKTSKYLRDKETPKTSKYLRTDDDDNNKEQKVEDKEYKSGRERYEAYLERDKKRLEMLDDETSDETEDESALPSVEITEADNTKENEGEEASKSVFKNGKGNRPKGVISSGRADKKQKHIRRLARMVFCCAIMEIAAVILQIFNFRVPFTPIPLSMDLSAIPELLSAIAYGPIVGIAVTLFKNVFYVLIFRDRALATALSNIILDSLFVIIASLIYTRGMFSPKAIRKKREKENLPKHVRTKQIIKSGAAGAVITTVLSYFAVNYVVLPIIFKQFGEYGQTEEAWLVYYQNAITTITGYLHIKNITLSSLKQGTLIFNIPLTFIKLIFVTLVDAVIYRWLSDFLHYRRSKK